LFDLNKDSIQLSILHPFSLNHHITCLYGQSQKTMTTMGFHVSIRLLGLTLMIVHFCQDRWR
jgi:hypothetical protein